MNGRGGGGGSGFGGSGRESQESGTELQSDGSSSPSESGAHSDSAAEESHSPLDRHSPAADHRRLYHLSASSSLSPVHVVKYDDPVDSEPDLLIDTEALHQRFRFFEDFREPEKQPKRFVMTPPRDFVKDQSPDVPAPVRDPNVVRCSDKLDDLPKTETAKKMLNVFKRLESQTDSDPSDRPGPKLPDDVRDVEPEMARSLKEKFENWTSTESERENNNKPASNCDSPNEETPQLDTTRKMLVMFKQLESQQNG
jgi:hypothetical protein